MDVLSSSTPEFRMRRRPAPGRRGQATSACAVRSSLQFLQHASSSEATFLQHKHRMEPQISDLVDQRIVVAIDAKLDVGDRWQVYTHGGRQPVSIEAVAWAKEAERRGAGEILLTSIDADGTRSGYDLALTRAVADAVNIPVIASGGAGSPQHLADVLTEGHADAALAASIFHEGTYPIRETKQYLKDRGIPVR